ncbi:polar amino acid transport system substrate-binding protein [Undibacterium sp. GrIS 1.8]|uniref:substrate-binding periplasmic protein n=1 Tax=unclassified Undibacterium TaxID=2630295 RepID=UPI003391D04E
MYTTESHYTTDAVLWWLTISCKINMLTEITLQQRRRKLISGLLTLLIPSFAWSEKSSVVLLLAEASPDQNPQIPVNDTFRKTMDYVEKELDVNFEIRHYPWNRLLKNLNQGEGLAFGLSKTKERLRTLHFSDPVYTSYVWMITLSNSVFPYQSIQDLKGKKIGIIRGSSYGDEFDAQKNSAFTVDEDTYSITSRLQKLINKRTDVILVGHRSDNPTKIESIINNLIPKLSLESALPSGVKFAVLGKPLSTDHIHFAILASQDNGIINRINTVIQKAKKTSALE